MENNDFKNITKPKEGEYTIYSKSGCPNCVKVKEMLTKDKIAFTVIDCDEYILECKADLLGFIKKMAQSDWTTFPMVFDKNAKFIGGYKDTIIHLERLLEFSDDF